MKNYSPPACGFAVSPVLLALLFFVASCRNESAPPVTDHSGWPAYAGGKDGIRYSSNDQINAANVSQLQVAWTFSSNDRDTGNRSQNQCNPIMVDGSLYGISPRSKLFALNAASGEQKWLFDPATEDPAMKDDRMAWFKVSRGVMYWRDGDDQRILYSAGARTFAVNAKDGRPIRSFGRNGHIDLSADLDREDTSAHGFVAATSPGIIYRNLLIIGIRVEESADAAPGPIRAYDIHTGRRVWIFHTIPHPGETGYETWPDKDAWKKLGAANDWAGMSLDEKRGIVYIPTGSVGGDFYGGTRKGQNLFANSLIALDAATGKYIWHYQIVHHDLWDRDLPAGPNLFTLDHDGQKIDAVAQITKHGYIFLFDRTNGRPVFPIEEKPVPTNGLPGEEPWPTQPIPTLPEPFARQRFDPEDVGNLDTASHADLVERYNKVKFRKMFAPPSKEGSWIFPGFDGGGEWGGAAVDPESGILYVNNCEMPWALTMIDVPKKKAGDFSVRGMGMAVAGKYCVACHGPELQGNGSSYPSLQNVGSKYHEDQIRKILDNGKNMMPSFRQIDESDKKAIIAYLLYKEPAAGSHAANFPAGAKRSTPTRAIIATQAPTAATPTAVKEPGAAASASRESGATVKEPVSARGGNPAKKSIPDEVPYTMTGYNRFYDKNGYPGITPPWGSLNAVDLKSGKLLWRAPLGEYPELTKRGIPVTGTENYGGPVVTKGGLVFIAATRDSKIRAFDKNSGKLLWEAPIPVPGYATPATYTIDGRQYLVIACGGGKIGSKSGDQYIAFALPVK